MFSPIILENDRVRLEPVAHCHISGLEQVINEGKLDKLFFTFVPSPNQLNHFVNDAEKLLSSNTGIAFTIFDKSQMRIIGSTRLFRADLAHKRAEIGFTFISPSSQGSGINIEMKRLMLTYAFEQLDLNRIEFLTDFLNHRSRRAILKLGAKEEGVIRNHMVMRDGRIRDSIVYSIIKNEWPGVKQHLAFNRA
ncbi:GNAT family N-acetyltransferase [Marinifaba aquimaris]|uniref:GNAT family N-acetyltransferase n=1 Tax=Marinifaba aquimaris TaxID=2741323 RepID=UPI001C2D25BB|nr:GNAT family protein [Marinifaba aquimaris]